MADVDELLRPFFDELMALRPVDATFLGIHDHDDRLPEGGRAEAEAERALLRKLRDRLADAGEGIDAEVARYFTELTLFELEDFCVGDRMATGGEVLGTGLFLLFARDFAPVEKRMESILARLEDAPRYLERSQERLEDPVKLWNEVALESVRELPTLLGEIVAAAPPALESRIRTAADAAREAIDDHRRWLEGEVIPKADPAFAIGEAGYERLLQLRRLPAPPDAILHLGREQLKIVKEQRQELVAKHWAGKSLAEVESAIRSDHAPAFDQALTEYRTSIAAARRFVEQHQLATIPAGEALDVIETPPFLRATTPFAAYFPAAPFDERQLGVYIVTPLSGSRALEEHNRPAIQNTSVHEAYPGHHLQFVCANVGRTLARVLSSYQAHEFVEGWAHYCEQLMYEEGFSSTPEVRFVQLTDLLWRACRVVIDVELSCGRMSFEEAVAMLVGEAGLSQEGARAEVNRYTYTPGYQLSYLYGKHLLLELRDRVQQKQGADFTLRGFHDTLLYAGALPAALWDRLF
jgi:uncharacterized protein (DUF885 family)